MQLVKSVSNHQTRSVFLSFHSFNCENLGGQKLEDTKQWLSEKGSEAKVKGAEILGATQQALATGAAIVTEKAKHGVELASEAATSVKTATENLAADASAKVVETAHNAQGT